MLWARKHSLSYELWLLEMKFLHVPACQQLPGCSVGCCHWEGIWAAWAHAGCEQACQSALGKEQQRGSGWTVWEDREDACAVKVKKQVMLTGRLRTLTFCSWPLGNGV